MFLFLVLLMSSTEEFNPVEAPYMAISHNNADLAEWNRYATELRLQEGRDAKGTDVHDLMKSRNSRGDDVVPQM